MSKSSPSSKSNGMHVGNRPENSMPLDFATCEDGQLQSKVHHEVRSARAVQGEEIASGHALDCR